MDRLLLSADLDLLLPRAAGERVRDRLLRAGERDFDLRILVRDLERDRLCLTPERERLDRLRRAGLRDLDRRFFLSDGELESLFLTGDLDLDCFLLDADLEVDLRGDEVERESFLSCCFFCIPGDAEPEELLCLLDVVLTGKEESSSSSEPFEQSDLFGSAPGSGEPDLDLETSCSSDELAGLPSFSLCSFWWLVASV